MEVPGLRSEVGRVIIYAVDPGLASGLALLHVPDGADPILLGSYEMDPDQTEDFTQLVCVQYKDHDLRVVMERFTITAETGKKSQASWSLQLIGSINYICRINGITEPTLQTPADAKSFAPNPRLKSLGLWHRGGHGHALDAIRHAVLYAVKNGYRSQKLLVE